MSTLVRIGCIALMLLTSACIGSSMPSRARMYGGEGERQYGNNEVDAALDKKFIGSTKDQLIIEYGPASRTASLDSGFKLMQYNSKRTIIYKDGRRTNTNCELRLWLRDATVRRVDYLGDQAVCTRFAVTGRKTMVDDDRLHFTNEYRLKPPRR